MHNPLKAERRERKRARAERYKEDAGKLPAQARRIIAELVVIKWAVGVVAAIEVVRYLREFVDMLAALVY